MLAILGGIGAALAWAGTTLFAAQATRYVDSWSLLATVMTVGLAIALPAALISGVPHHVRGSSLGWLFASGSGNVAGLLLTYRALRIGKIGVVAPITSTEGAVAAVLAVIAGEHLAGGKAAALVVVAAGIALAAHTRNSDPEIRRSDARAALLAAAAAFSFGLSLYSTGRVGQALGVAWAALPPRVVGVTVIAVPLLVMRRWHIVHAALPFAVAGGIFEVLGFVSYAFGARHGLAIAAVLASQFAALSAVAGYLLYGERLTRLQVLGIGAIVAGVSLLSAVHG